MALVAAAVAAQVLFAPRDSRANGRYPEANQLAVDPVDPSHLVARTTFGVLRSIDAGASWSWTCEESITPFGLLDEEILITSGGRTAVALSDGIAISDGTGCDWSAARGDVVGRQVIDIVGDATAAGRAYAGVRIIVDGTLNGRIARTEDGLTWSFIGQLLQDTVPVNIDVARSRPERLYLGVNDGDFEFGFIDVSDDGGSTWVRHEAPRGPDSVYVSAVDPANPDRVYVRSTFPEPTLYVSEDGARTWTAIYAALDDLKGFALSPDGKTVAVGGKNGLVTLKRTEGSTGASTFTTTVLPALTVSCLTWTTAGLFVCADQATDGFAIGLSVDEGHTFKPLLRLADLVPARCAGRTEVALACPGRWCPTATLLGASCAVPVAPAASGCGCGLAGLARPTWHLPLATASALLALCGAGRTRRRRARR